MSSVVCSEWCHPLEDSTDVHAAADQLSRLLVRLSTAQQLLPPFMCKPSRTVPQVFPTPAAVDSTETAVNTFETSVDSTETAVDSTETAVDSTETVVDSTETVVDSTETAVDSTETAADSTETAVNARQGLHSLEHTTMHVNRHGVFRWNFPSRQHPAVELNRCKLSKTLA